MVSITEAARSMWLPGLSSLRHKPNCSMHDWLEKANYAPSVAGDHLELTGLEFHHLLRAFAGDINRVTSAASESLRNVAASHGMPKSLAWSYVKIYYSALFYAHSLLRLWGKSPSYLRTTDLIRLRNSVNAYAMTAPFKLVSGQYVMEAKYSSTSLLISSDKSGGGTHESVWREFGKSLDYLKVNISQSNYTSFDKKNLTDIFSSAAMMITNKGSNASWLSTMRNDIQYRQTEGLWFPYSGKGKASDLSLQVTGIFNWNTPVEEVLNADNNNLARFRSACFFIILFARSIIADMSNISGPDIFLKYGQAGFERSVIPN